MSCCCSYKFEHIFVVCCRKFLVAAVVHTRSVVQMAFVAVVAASVTGAALMTLYRSYRTVTVCIIMPYCCAMNDAIACCSWYDISFLLLLLLLICCWNVFVVVVVVVAAAAAAPAPAPAPAPAITTYS